VSDSATKMKILCVDDEQRIVDSIALNLRKEYEVQTATSGADALRRLREVPGIAVVVSDMRMPGMDGATLLQEVMHNYPGVARILLTGEAGRDAAALAVNKGQILRFLTKPCPLDELKKAIEAGVSQYRLANIERAVLQETLLGCIHALVDLLALTNPLAFGRANRVQQRSVEFANYLGMPGYWQLEAAAILSQIGYIALPMSLVGKLYRGEPLSAAEAEMAAGAPEVATRLLDRVPRLEPVIQILVALNWDDAAVTRLGDGTIGLAARILGMVLEFDTLTTQGNEPGLAAQMLKNHSVRYGESLVARFGQYVGSTLDSRDVREIDMQAVEVGMVILQDLYGSNGTLLVSRGYRVTEAFRERAANLGPELEGQRVRVLVPAA
jgi:response regulator RpfG family c-di-GMP phosphodiesterase